MSIIYGPWMPGGWERVSGQDTPNQGAMQMSNSQPRLVEAEVNNETDAKAILRVYKNLMKLPTQEARREYLSKFSVPMQQAVSALAKKLRKEPSVSLSNPATRVHNPVSDPNFGHNFNEETLAAITPSAKANIEVAKRWNKNNPDDRVPETNEGGLSLRAMGFGGEIPSAAEMESLRSDDPFEDIHKRHQQYLELAGFNEPPLSAEERAKWGEDIFLY